MTFIFSLKSFVLTNSSKRRTLFKNKKWLGVNTERRTSYYLYSSKKEKEFLMGDDSFGNAIWKELNTKAKDFEAQLFIMKNVNL